MRSTTVSVFLKVICIVFAGPTFSQAATPLKKLGSCTLVPTKWADGDSFLIRTATGEEKTIRLYGADCLEASINDESDARRLRAQRRYFGITRVKPNARASIELAKELGRQATKETAAFLKQPFTVYTAFADARGDGRYQRFYGFVVDQNGRDLAAHLVSKGLARAYGVYRETYKGLSHDDYRESLRDLELLAAKRGSGIWAHTNWEDLTGERKLQREEEAETRLAIDDSKLPSGAKINPNTAARDELMRLPGIGETIANRLIGARPFKNAEGLLTVDGIGRTTLARIRPFLIFE
jgi:endonuclease YncB( thermonuclease family)